MSGKPERDDEKTDFNTNSLDSTQLTHERCWRQISGYYAAHGAVRVRGRSFETTNLISGNLISTKSLPRSCDRDRIWLAEDHTHFDSC